MPTITNSIAEFQKNLLVVRWDSLVSQTPNENWRYRLQTLLAARRSKDSLGIKLERICVSDAEHREQVVQSTASPQSLLGSTASSGRGSTVHSTSWLSLCPSRLCDRECVSWDAHRCISP